MKTRLEQTEIFKELVARCQAGKSGCLNPTALQGTIIQAAQTFTDLLNRTCTNFPDYTLHDEDHALRVTFLMHRLLPPGVLARMSVLDLTLLILAAYGHDIGMALGRERRDQILGSDDYRAFLLENELEWQESEKARLAGDARRHEFIWSQLFQKYLRNKHHVFSAEALQRDFSGLLLVEGKSLAVPLARLAQSHGEPMEFVSKLKHFPFAGEFNSDLPFLACVLRLADYLDLDAARAPESLMRLIRPENEVSRREWRKNQASNFYVDSQTIRFQAQFTDFFDEKALRDTLRGIETERRECMEFLRGRSEPDGLTLELSTRVVAEIESNGYIYAEFKFALEYREIISLLMGTRLYRDERAFVRELIQNSLDACRVAWAANAKSGRANYAGRIVITHRRQEDGPEIVEVSDNGSGMTRTIIHDYFMRVGRSYYRSFAFRRKSLDMSPVSQFGIGILSCFMVADYLEVETSPDPLVHAEARGEELSPLRLEIRGPHEYFVVRTLERPNPGTTVRLFLKQPLVGSLQSMVTRFLSRCPFPVEIREPAKAPLELVTDPFDFESELFRDLFISMPGSFGYVSRDLVIDGKFGFAVHGRIRLFLLEADNRRFLRQTNVGRYSFVGFDRTGRTLLNVKQLTPEVQRNTHPLLQQVRGLATYLPGSCRLNLESIVRGFEETMEHLLHQHTEQQVELMWTSLTAQTDALNVNAAFNSSPVSGKINQILRQAIAQIDSFVRGELRLSAPTGLLTQDGIRLSSFFHLEDHLQPGLGYLFNLDLCGDLRLSLTAARDNVMPDEKLDLLSRYIYQQMGRFLGGWFREEGIPEIEVAEYLRSVPKVLAEAVNQSFRPGAAGAG